MAPKETSRVKEKKIRQRTGHKLPVHDQMYAHPLEVRTYFAAEAAAGLVAASSTIALEDMRL